jgi:hypothetical protein
MVSSLDSRGDREKQLDGFLFSLGLIVIHIIVTEVPNNMESVTAFLRYHPTLAGTPPQEGNRRLFF